MGECEAGDGNPHWGSSFDKYLYTTSIYHGSKSVNTIDSQGVGVISYIQVTYRYVMLGGPR
jgi:hypothetical protein